ncbi:hypothetical protein MT354_07645 [Clostridium tertium]|nr:hypothetical protein [Clostridium tertium]
MQHLHGSNVNTTSNLNLLHPSNASKGNTSISPGLKRSFGINKIPEFKIK